MVVSNIRGMADTIGYSPKMVAYLHDASSEAKEAGLIATPSWQRGGVYIDSILIVSAVRAILAWHLAAGMVKNASLLTASPTVAGASDEL